MHTLTTVVYDKP